MFLMVSAQVNMKPRVIYIHGNQTSHWSSSWPKWLKPELEKLGFPTFFETFPDSIIARQEYWLPFLKDFVKAGKNDVLLGWSSGAVAAMRYAETTRIKGSILVSPSYTDLGDPLERQSGYFDTPWKWSAIKKNQKHIALFYGDDDPYIPQKQFAYIASRLHVRVTCLKGAKHFIDRESFPELLEYITATYM